LWCSFELAAFTYILKSKPDVKYRIEVSPLDFAKYMFGMMLSNVSLSWVLCFKNFQKDDYSTNRQHSTEEHEVEMLVLMLPVFVCWFAIPTCIAVASLQEYTKQYSVMANQFAEYSLQNTQCFDPADRIKVYDSVTRWFEPQSLDEDQAIAKFDSFVREELWLIVRESVPDPAHLPYSVAMRLSLPVMWFHCFCQLPMNTWLPTESYVGFVCMVFGIDLVGFPLGYLLLVKWVSLCMRIRACFAGLAPHDSSVFVRAISTVCSYAVLVVVEVVLGNVLVLVPVLVGAALPGLKPVQQIIAYSIFTAFAFWMFKDPQAKQQTYTQVSVTPQSA
jgi:hypothetical protein